MIPLTAYNVARLTVLKVLRRLSRSWVIRIQLGSQPYLDLAGIIQKPSNEGLIDRANHKDDPQQPKNTPILKPIIQTRKVTTIQKHMVVLPAGDKLESFRYDRFSTTSARIFSRGAPPHVPIPTVLGTISLVCRPRLLTQDSPAKAPEMYFTFPRTTHQSNLSDPTQRSDPTARRLDDLRGRDRTHLEAVYLDEKLNIMLRCVEWRDSQYTLP